jgi:oxygen-dependent protoporphyrinogen oxidase
MTTDSRHDSTVRNDTPETDASVGIVGAGITGLALHHEFVERTVESVVFEAESEPGGVLRSVPHGDTVLETGPQRTRLTGVVRDALSAGDVEDRILTADRQPTYVYRAGGLRRVPTTVTAAVRTDLLSWRAKARLLLEPLTDEPRSGESVAAFFERTLGVEAATYLAAPLYAGLYGSDPAEMPVEHSLAKALERFDASDSVVRAAARARLRRREPPPMVTLTDGLQTLPNGLADRYADSVHLETPVQGISAAETGYRLHTAAGTTRVDRVVLTTPAPTTASLLADVDPGSARALDRLQYNPLVVVHLEAETDLQGAGCQLPFDSPFRTLGTTWNASLFDRDGIYTSYLGGAKAPRLVHWSDDRLGRCGAVEFEAITGFEASPIRVTRLRPGMPAYDGSWSALEGTDLPAGITLCANYESRAGIPGRLRAAKRLASRLSEDAER